MLNLLLKIVCNFDGRQRQWWRGSGSGSGMQRLLPLFFQSNALYLFHSVKYLLLPCAIFCRHTQTIEFIEWRDCNYSIRLFCLLLYDTQTKQSCHRFAFSVFVFPFVHNGFMHTINMKYSTIERQYARLSNFKKWHELEILLILIRMLPSLLLPLTLFICQMFMLCEMHLPMTMAILSN